MVTIGVGTLLATLAIVVPVLVAFFGLGIKLALVIGKHTTMLEAAQAREANIAEIPAIKSDLTAIRNNLGTLTTKVHEIHTRVVVVERTKRSRDDMKAVRPGEYRASRPEE